ncbi:hypothetical protein ACIBJC_14335 [Streptomyces sp. NPDC050509]|uniref:hypothetical protein n=1 Tax=Streptomyces sp. NPDC050509 TaxID=3365620 RepID=UPI0037A1EED4
MSLQHLILDDPTLLALGGGNKPASALVMRGYRNPDVRLLVPTLCLLEADRKREGIGVHAGSLNALHTVDLDFPGSLHVAELARAGVPIGVAHAAVTAAPAADRPNGAIVATVAPENYEGLRVAVLDLNK